MEQFSDVAYYDFLVEASLTPAKSKTIGPLKVPSKFYADFLRGLFDGDGTCYGYMDPRWKSSFMFYMGFSSASQPFLAYLQSTNSKLMDVSKGSIRNGAGASLLAYAKTDSHKLATCMYYSSDVISLSRKRLKLQRFISLDKAMV